MAVRAQENDHPGGKAGESKCSHPHDASTDGERGGLRAGSAPGEFLRPALEQASEQDCEQSAVAELRYLVGLAGSNPVEPGFGSESKPNGDWRRWLAGGGAREVLARIAQGDPLGLRALVGRYLRSQAILLDGDRVYLRCLALCARSAASYRGRPLIAQWLEELVRKAIVELRREHGAGAEGSSSPAICDFATRLGLDPQQTERSCYQFLELPEADRRAFFDLVIEQQSLDELARAASVSASEIARRARRALLSLMAAGPSSNSPSSHTSPRDSLV